MMGDGGGDGGWIGGWADDGWWVERSVKNKREVGAHFGLPVPILPGEASPAGKDDGRFGDIDD